MGGRDDRALGACVGRAREFKSVTGSYGFRGRIGRPRRPQRHMQVIAEGTAIDLGRIGEKGTEST